MYTPIYLLPQYNAKDRDRFEDRWTDPNNKIIRDEVLEAIRRGAGKNFLSSIYEQHLDFFEDINDLKGINIINEEIRFPTNDNFVAIDFSYAFLSGLKFTNAVFSNSNIYFAYLSGCEFVNCIFAYGAFYGATLVNTMFIKCDFVDIRMTNCGFERVTMTDCFAPKRLFFECKFDETTAVDELIVEPNRMSKDYLKLNKKDLSEIYQGIKESYLAGGIIEKSRIYFYKQKQSSTRYNSGNRCSRLLGHFLELVAGYGTRPDRVLYTMLITYFLFTAFFTFAVGWSDGYLVSAGAFFTFGANSHLLEKVGFFAKVLYIIESFFGLSLVATFITVLVNYWFQER